MEEALHQIGHDVRLDPLADLHRAILNAMQKIASDDQFRRVFEMSTFKVEYVDDLLAVKSRQLQVQVDVVCQMQRCLRDASAHLGVPLQISLLTASQGLHALVVGLLNSWLLVPEAFDLVGTADVAIRTYLHGSGFDLSPPPAPQ